MFSRNSYFPFFFSIVRIIGDIVAPYDPDQLYPSYGFGAVLGGRSPANHCFALNLNEGNPNCFGIDGILQAYVNVFPHIQLSGPTNFAPIISRVISFAEQSKNGDKYFILLMITDGIITDMDNTIAALRKASNLPLLIFFFDFLIFFFLINYFITHRSIIIIGVGNADFSSMEILDDDDNSLKMARDIVQFVPFRKFSQSPLADLAKEVLAEVPQQLVQYMLSKNISPRFPPPV